MCAQFPYKTLHFEVILRLWNLWNMLKLHWGTPETHGSAYVIMMATDVLEVNTRHAVSKCLADSSKIKEYHSGIYIILRNIVAYASYYAMYIFDYIH